MSTHIRPLFLAYLTPRQRTARCIDSILCLHRKWKEKNHA